jgi:hypothetical protein
MTTLHKRLARSLRPLRWIRTGLPSALLLAAGACGPLSEGEPSTEAPTVAQRADALDTNECATGTNNCSAQATCTDTAEGFTCACNADFAGDGVNCDRVSHTVELEPVADAHVYLSDYTNYGSRPELKVAHEAFRYGPPVVESYLRFELSGLPAGSRVKSVKLQATAFSVRVTFHPSVDIQLVQDDSWSESRIHYFNKPAHSTWLGGWNNRSPGLAVSAEPALATAVQNELDGDRKLSVRVGSTGVVNDYHSREAADATKRPKLIVTYDFVKVLEPVADAKVLASQPSSNFGTAQDFSVGPAWHSASQLEHSFLRFDMSSLPANARISSVKLQAMAYTGWAWGGDGNVYTHLVQNDAWSETGLTWNNQPAISGTQLGYWWLWYDSRYVDSLGVNDAPALAATARSEFNGDKQLSVRLSSPGYITYYYSREVADANKRPKLEIHYVESELCSVAPNVPTLTLNGSSQMTLECGLSTWTDPGARATDACGSLEVHRYNSGSDAYGPGPNMRAEGSYSVQYIAWSTTGATVSASRTVNVNDSTAPSLRLRGAAQLTHTCGSQFVDPGVEAMDACYGDVSPTVRVTGSVNGWAPGTYTLRYDVTDSGGNSAAPVTRTVNVVNCPW